MGRFSVGDLVRRKGDPSDIVYIVTRIKSDTLMVIASLETGDPCCPYLGEELWAKPALFDRVSPDEPVPEKMFDGETFGFYRDNLEGYFTLNEDGSYTFNHTERSLRGDSPKYVAHLNREDA